MNLPHILLWGVDTAIKKIRPGANFELSNSTFTHWEDSSGLGPPSWEEIHAQIEKDQSAAEKWLEQNKE
jgi:hypothetical protein